MSVTKSSGTHQQGAHVHTKSLKISESILYDRAVERQQSEERLRVAANKLTAHVTRPGGPSFRQLYDQTAFGSRRVWQIRDMIDMAIEAGAPDEDCLAFPQQLLAETEQALAARDKRRETPNVNAALTVETIAGHQQDIAGAQAVAENFSVPSVQKLFDRTLRHERRDRTLLKACRAVLSSRGLHLTLNGGVKQW